MNSKISTIKLSQLIKTIKIKPNQIRKLTNVSSVNDLNGNEFANSVKKELHPRFVSIIKQNRIFNEESRKQRESIGRLSKIEVKVKDCRPHPNTTLLMNKSLSSPADCARHLSELYFERSIIAKVNGQIWDMNRPLEEDCELTFHHFNEEDTFEVNKAFWRSCSFLLGKVISNSFKKDIDFHLHSWPKPNFKSGSFIYDVQLPTLEKWVPRETELLTLTKAFWNLYPRKLQFERLCVPITIAKELFKDNPFKSKQLEEIEQKDSQSNITLYRVGKYIDFSIGPMIPHTGVIGKVNITAVHQIEASCGKLYRFQGCALPAQLPMHFYAYEILLKRSKSLNSISIP